MTPRRVVLPGLLAAAVAALAVVPAGVPAQSPGFGDDIANRLRTWETTDSLKPFTLGLPTTPTTPVTPPPSQPGTRTRIALCFGVNQTDPAWYGSTNPLAGPENDMRDHAAFAKQLNFEVTTFATRQATSKNLFAELKKAAARLQSGDILLVTYAGHGSTVKDLNGDEFPNTEDQTWCLFDRMVIDDELYEAWTQFRAGVRIYVVADSCHSGSSTRALERVQNPAAQRNSAGARALANGGSFDDVQVRTLTRDQKERAAAIQLPAFDAIWRGAPRSGQSGAEMKAAGLLFAGCDDHETSGERGGHGLFTSALVRAVDGGRFTGTYRELINKAAAGVGDPNQHPKLFQFGALGESNAENARPFAD